MRTFLYLSMALALIIGFSSANLNFIGFSKDGRYLAFEESGTYDGSGGDFSTTYFIDTVKNTFALPPIEINEGDEYTAAEKRIEAARNRKLRSKLAANLRRLKIVAGNTGELIVAHLLTDFTYENSNRASEQNDEIIKFNNFLYVNSTFEGHYELILKNIPATGDERCDSQSHMLELALLDKTTDKTIPPKILQKDKTLPKSRWCPYYYRVEKIYSYDDKLAVFLNYFNQGFEGRSMRYMVVTTQLDYQQ